MAPACLARAFAVFTVMRECALRELMLIYALSFTAMLGYFVFSYVLVLHLVEELGLDDEATGMLYGIFGISIAVWSILLGVVVDRIGVRMSLAVGNGVGALGTLAFAFVRADQRVAMGLILFVVLPFSLGLSSPAVPIAIRRFSSARAQQLSFSIYYTVMNLSAVLAAPLVDVARTMLPPSPYQPGCLDGVCAASPPVVPGDVNQPVDPPMHLPLPRYALLIAASAVTGALATLFSFALRDAEAVDGPPAGTVRRGMLVEMRETVRNPNFWKFVTLSGALIGVKSTFRYLDALYPVYVERAFSPAETAGVPYMTLLAINPAIVIALTVFIDRAIARFRTHPVNVILAGAALSGLSPFIMMATTPGVETVFIVVFSFGEILWSPTLYTYTCALAPKGNEGAFFALANVPLFAAKLLTGSLSGFLLGRYCPSHPPAPAAFQSCNGAAMWGLIGATTASSVVLLAFVRRYVTVPLDFMLPKVAGVGGVVADVHDTSYVRLNEEDVGDGGRGSNPNSVEMAAASAPPGGKAARLGDAAWQWGDGGGNEVPGSARDGDGS